MSDRFDFEQQIMKCWNVTDDIAEISEAIAEGNIVGTDNIVNSLNGLESMYSLKFNKLWNQFETVVMNIVRENKMLNEECAAMREQLSDAYDGQGYGIAAIKPNKKGK